MDFFYGGHKQLTQQGPLTLTSQSVAKRPTTKHVPNAHSTLVSLPVGNYTYINPRLGYFRLQKQELLDKPTNPLPFPFSAPLISILICFLLYPKRREKEVKRDLTTKK